MTLLCEEIKYHTAQGCKPDRDHELPDCGVRGALLRCFEGKGCNACGACCDFLNGFPIPDREHIQGTEIEMKRGRCPHLSALSDHKKICAVHQQKDFDRRLNVCNGFDGSTSARAQALLVEISVHICFPANIQEIQRIEEEYLAPGIFEGVMERLSQEIADRLSVFLERFLDVYLQNIQYIPHELFDAINLSEILSKLYVSNREEFIRIGHKFPESLNTSTRLFREKYWPDA